MGQGEDYDPEVHHGMSRPTREPLRSVRASSPESLDGRIPIPRSPGLDAHKASRSNRYPPCPPSAWPGLSAPDAGEISCCITTVGTCGGVRMRSFVFPLPAAGSGVSGLPLD
jgi:hypothetical protein